MRSNCPATQDKVDTGVAGIEGYAGLHPGFMDLLQNPVQVDTGFLMNRHILDAGIGQAVDIRFGIGHHQMGIEGKFRNRAQSLDDGHAEGEIGYKMAVHQIEMDTVGPLLFDVFNFFS